MTNEPDDMARARRLLEEFERAGGLSKQDCFEEAIILLRDFSTEHPNSEFSEIANNLRYTYTKILIEKLSSVSFSNYADWFATWEWTRRFSEEIEKVIIDNPPLKDSFNKFEEFWKEKPFQDELNKSIQEELKKRGIKK